jgi:hypothetical protein
MRFCIAAVRIFTSSSRGFLPDGVLIIKAMSLFFIRSMTFGCWPLASLGRISTLMPASEMTLPVPLVA